MIKTCGIGSNKKIIVVVLPYSGANLVGTNKNDQDLWHCCETNFDRSDKNDWDSLCWLQQKQTNKNNHVAPFCITKSILLGPTKSSEPIETHGVAANQSHQDQQKRSKTIKLSPVHWVPTLSIEPQSSSRLPNKCKTVDNCPTPLIWSLVYLW